MSVSTAVSGPTAAADRTPRFSSRQQEQTAKVDEAKLNKAEMKATDHPVAATKEEAATEKTQAAPLGLRYVIRFCYKQDIPNGIGSYNPIRG